MTAGTASALRYLLERSALRDPSLSDEDRAECFAIALRGLPQVELDWLCARLAQEQRERGRAL